MTAPSAKVAVVVGASGGIGRAITRRLAERDISMVVGYRSQRERAEQIVAELHGTNHTSWPIAVTEAASLDALREHVESTYGRLDVLVNAAAVTRPVPHDDLDALDDTLIDEILQCNWRGPFATIRALRPLLLRGTDPVIINISSIAAVTSQGSNVAYCASKAALDSMTRSLGRALAPKIRVLSVSPGWVLGEYADRMDSAYLDTQVEQTPLGRLATPDDVAYAVVAATLLTASTGSILAVDGGRPLGKS